MKIGKMDHTRCINVLLYWFVFKKKIWRTFLFILDASDTSAILVLRLSLTEVKEQNKHEQLEQQFQ